MFLVDSVCFADRSGKGRGGRGDCGSACERGSGEEKSVVKIMDVHSTKLCQVLDGNGANASAVKQDHSGLRTVLKSSIRGPPLSMIVRSSSPSRPI